MTLINISNIKHRIPGIVNHLQSLRIPLSVKQIVSMPCYGYPKTKVETAKRDIAVISQEYDDIVICTLNGKRILILERAPYHGRPDYIWYYVNNKAERIKGTSDKKGFPTGVKVKIKTR